MQDLQVKPEVEPEVLGPPYEAGLLWPNEIEFDFSWYERKPFAAEIEWSIGGNSERCNPTLNPTNKPECEVGGVIVLDKNGLIIHQWTIVPMKLYSGDKFCVVIKDMMKSGWRLRKENP